MTAIKRNLAWLLFSQAATWGVSIALLLIVPDSLGDASFGQLSFVMVYMSFFELIALFGTTVFLSKTIARDTASAGRYLFNALALKSILATLVAGTAIALAVLLDYPRLTLTLICIGCLSLIFTVLNSVAVGVYQGLQRMRRPALWEVVRSYVAAGAGLTVLLNGGTLVQYALVFSLASAIPLIANLLGLRSELAGNRLVSVPLWSQILVGGFPFLVWAMLLAFYGTIDIPLLEAFSGNETVGWYALAYRWVSMPVFIAGAVATACFPALSAQGKAIGPDFARTANRALKLVILVAAPAATGIALIARDFVTTLYGPEFQPAVPLMHLLALHIPIVALDMILASTIVATDRQRPWVMVGIVAAIFNPLLNLIAIPLTERTFDNGAIGAAFVTVLTELILMVGAIRLRPREVLDRDTRHVLLRIALASSAMVPVVVLLGSTSLAVQMTAGAVAYVAASFVLRTVSWDELRTWMPALNRGARDADPVSSEPTWDGDTRSGAEPVSSSGERRA